MGETNSYYDWERTYRVVAIGYSYDGKHDFSPYEHYTVHTETESSFDMLGRERSRFGTTWAYDFGKLKDYHLLTESTSPIEELGLQPQDHLFNIEKVANSQLLYEVKRKTFDDAWEMYKDQLQDDIAFQVLITNIAGWVSIGVQVIIIAATLGTGALGPAQSAKFATYMGIYTLLTKFNINMKTREAESKRRAETFYPESATRRHPTSLNERSLMDRVLKDSMFAGLIGHPGGYYRTVRGGTSGNDYTTEVLVSPPNSNAASDLLSSTSSFFDLLIDNYKKQAENDQEGALKIKRQIQDKIVLQKQQYAQKLENRKAWKIALKSDLFKGALMLLPSIFTGRIGLFGFGKMFKGVVGLPGIRAVALGNHRTRQQALRKVEGDPSLPSVESVFLNNLETQMKTLADLDGQDLNALFAGLEEPPITIQFPEVNLDPKIDLQLDLAMKFDTIANRFGITDQDYQGYLMQMNLGWGQSGPPRDIDLSESSESDHTYLSPWHLETAYDVQLSDIAVEDPYEGLFPQFDKESTLFIYDSLYGSEEQILQKTPQTVDRIVYPVGEINDAVEALTDRKYEDMDIIGTAYGEPTGIYYDVQDRIFGKLNRGEDLNRLERLILSVGAYLMGGKQADIEERIESILINRFQKETGKAALGFSGETEDFQEWKENNRDLIEEIKNDLLGLAEKKKKQEKTEEVKNIQRSLDTFTIADTRVNPNLWFKDKNGNRLIDSIIEEQLDLRTTIGKETKKTIYKLMEKLEREKKYKRNSDPTQILLDKKGREYLSFNDPDFENFLEQYENGKDFGGLLYLLSVQGEFYVGLTERRFEVRLREHILAAILGYVLTRGDVNKPGYAKLQDAIVKVLEKKYDIKKLDSELRYYATSNQRNKENVKIKELMNFIEPFIKGSIIEFHYSPKKLGAREKFFTKRLPIQKLIENNFIFTTKYNSIVYLDTKKQGLNSVYGGATSTGYSLPIYDITIMVAMGLTGSDIAKILQEKYFKLTSNKGLKELTRTVQYHIAEKLGGTYEAHRELIKPIIEMLAYESEIPMHLIYQEGRYKKLESNHYGRVKQWSLGQEYLNKDLLDLIKKKNLRNDPDWETIKEHIDEIKVYYAGYSEETFKFWMLNKPFFAGKGNVLDIIGTGDRKLKEIVKILCEKYNEPNLNSLKYKFQKEKIISLFSKGYIVNEKGEKVPLRWDNWVNVIFREYEIIRPTRSDRKAESHLENYLFPGIDLDDIFKLYYKKSK